MKLVIDIGNTNIVMAIYDGDNQIEKHRLPTNGDIDSLLVMLPDVEDIIVGSVVPKINDKINAACQKRFGKAPVFVTAKNAGIEIDLDRPEEVGADRLINAVAVKLLYGQPAIIVDFGTATTFDVIDAKGRYSGGVIAPGINLSLQALEQAAAQLPNIEVAKPPKVIGKNTVEAMQSGIYWGYIGLIEGTIKRIQAEMGADCLVIATGGLAPLFCDGTEMIEKADADLTLRGLAHIHNSHDN